MQNRTPEQFFKTDKDTLIQRLLSKYQKKGVCISVNYKADGTRVFIEGNLFGVMPTSIDTYKRLRRKLKDTAKLVLHRKMTQLLSELKSLNAEDFNQTLIRILRDTGHAELIKTKDLGWQVTLKHYALRGVGLKD
jgi:hypothetical protein